MTAKSEASKTLDEAFRAALLLTGSTEVAENAVLDGIAASEFGHIVDDILLEAVDSAIQRRAAFSDQSAQVPSHLPLELRRLFLINPISREFNPEGLHVLERHMPQVWHGRFVVQPGSATSYGHLTMAHPELWAKHVAEFMRELGDTPRRGGEAE
jgi:hypothetical protein